MTKTHNKHKTEKRPVGWARWIPIAMLVVSVLYAFQIFRPAKDEGAFKLSEWGALPMVDQGRIKPIDTMARTTLMIMSNKATMWLDHASADGTSEREEVEGHRKITATRWLMDVMANPEQARQYRVMRIDHPDVLSLVEAEDDRKYFSVHELMHHREKLNDQIERARSLPSREHSPYHRALLRLSQQLGIYFSIEDVVGLLMVPPAVGAEEWRSLREAQSQFSETLPPEAEAHINTLTAWHEENPAEFNSAIAAYSSQLDSNLPEVMGKVRFEEFFNRAAPFIKSMGLYVLAFILAALSWLRMSRPLSRAAFNVLLVALTLHTLGLVARIYIQGRPPVTNLYSSAVFTGWGCVILGLFLERFYRNGVGAVTAATTGFVTLLVAHHLSLEGDTMTMMQAVLDTNFWLATHVVVITLGYSATFLAGFLGTLYVLRGVFTKSLTREGARSLSRMIYGIVCFATLFSFVGTILGGIWADQSWGRFWGWDPKENGALLIVLWNALVLHARWGGMARQRGLANLAIAGNIVTAWSWFGTNMLGVGLHSYGFIDSALFWMFVFVVSQLGLIAIGSLPLARWRSNIMPAPTHTPPAKARPPAEPVTAT